MTTKRSNFTKAELAALEKKYGQLETPEEAGLVGQMTLAEYLRSMRKTKELSQAQVAKLLGVSKQLINRWESGAQDCPPAQAYKLAKVLEGPSKKIFELAVLKLLAKNGVKMQQEAMKFVSFMPETLVQNSRTKSK